MIPADLDFPAVAAPPIMRTWTIAYDDDVTVCDLTHLPGSAEYIISADGLSADRAARLRIALAFSGATDAHAAPDDYIVTAAPDTWYVLASIAARPPRPGMAP